ncbi:hypothetical protein PIB30_005197 [Stylosanthes scabra]|uniref:Uncharacterized protein n=1 Tax=Stylosanthes scabra TaxID=79078 RepID=A0ABU6S472_9FABA|nr:hypothetical protein [Stylosanthes scabra]
MAHKKRGVSSSHLPPSTVEFQKGEDETMPSNIQAKPMQQNATTTHLRLSNMQNHTLLKKKSNYNGVRKGAEQYLKERTERLTVKGRKLELSPATKEKGRQTKATKNSGTRSIAVGIVLSSRVLGYAECVHERPQLRVGAVFVPNSKAHLWAIFGDPPRQTTQRHEVNSLGPCVSRLSDLCGLVGHFRPLARTSPQWAECWAQLLS